MGTCGWVIWHLRENASPAGSTIFKIFMANLHMVIKRRLQDKNMISPSSEGTSTPITQTVDLTAKHHRRKNPNKI